MAQRIVYSRPDGGIAIVIPVRPKKDGESDDEYIASIAKRAVPKDAIDVKVIDHTDLPADRRWRGAWRQESGKVSVDVAAAAAIRQAELLSHRDTVLTTAVAETAKAEENGDDKRKALLLERRKALRSLDLSPDLSALKTIDEMVAFKGPSVLTDPLP